ncbi:MAG: translocation/assembly module TamB domain-containing protein [Chlamydiales bacterium]|nr:translocation/assembly module TamB domain-containing protein [Chlamydiales bacterium]
MKGSPLARKLIRYFLRTLAALVLALALLAAIGYGLLNIGPVNEVILKYAKRQIEQNSGWRFNAKKMDRLSPFSLRLRQVEMTRPGSATITADRISLTFAPHQLMLGQIVFPSITMRDVQVLDNTDEAPAASPIPATSMPMLPFGMRIERFEVSNLNVPDQSDLSLNIVGELQASTLYQTGVIDLVVEDSSLQSDPTYILLTAYQDSNALHIDTRAAEDANGILHHLLNALEGYSVEFTAYSTTTLGKSLFDLSIDELVHSCHSNGQFTLLVADSETDDIRPTGILGDTARIAGCYDWQPDKALAFSDMLIESKRENTSLRLAGDVSLTSALDLTNARFYVEVDDIAATRNLCPHPLGGSVEGSGTVTGSWSNPKIDIDIKTIGFSVDGKPFGDVRLQGEGSCSGDNVHGSLALCCDIGPVVTNSTFDIEWDFGPKLAVHDIHWQSPTAALRGNLDISLETFQAEGRLEGETGDLAWFIPKEFGEVHGTGWVSMDFSSQPEAGEQIVDVLTEMTRLDFANLYSERMELTAHLEDLFSNPSGSVKITAKDTRVDKARVKDIMLETHIPPNNAPWRYRLMANGKWDGKFLVKATGTANPYDSTITVDDFIGRLHDHTLLLAKPLSVSWTDDSTTINDLSLKVGQGSLAGSGTLSRNTDLSLQANKIPLDLVHLLLPQSPVEGTVSGDLHLMGTVDNPEGTLSLSLDDILVAKEGLLNIPPLHAQAKGQLKDKILDIDGSIIGIGDQPVAVTARLPMQVTLSPLEVTTIPDRSLTAHITASGEVTPLLHLLFADINVTGEAHVALDISGTYAAPLVDGTLDLSDCTFEDLSTGSVFKNIQAHFVGRGNQIALTSLTAEDGYQGVATGSGVINLDLANKCPFNIAFYIDRALLLRRDYVQGVASGELYLTGTFEDILLSGNLSANTMTITLPKEMPTPAASLDITFLNTPAKTTAALPEARNERPMRFEVNIDIPGRAFMRSDDLRSEWLGNVTVSGTSMAPQFNGQLRVASGDYRLNGRSFVLDKGTITFGGDLDKKTTLYVVARQDIDQYTIEAVLKGPLRDPMLTLRSNPHMSQREILSWIIFNRGLNDITPFENDMAGQAVVDLSTGKSSTPDMMARLRRFGIDRLDVTGASDPDNRDLVVNIGKYLSRDCFISLNRGLTSDSNSVSLEANLIKYVKFQAEVDDEATGGVRLMWKHDY